MSIDNLFQLATRQKLRFPSNRGDLTVEQLWDLALTHKTQFDLDNVAKAINTELKAAAEESFVKTTVNPAKVRLETALEIVKHIISVRLAEAEANRKAQENKEERQKLLAILGQKEDAALAELTPEQIRERIAALEQ